MNSTTSHTFHIPVLGLCFSIDTPVKVARFGISSVVSIIEDELIEHMRAYHSLQNNIAYQPIPAHEEDYRAKRITKYLDLLNDLVEAQIKKLKEECFISGSEVMKYFEMLPDHTVAKQKFREAMAMPESQEKEEQLNDLKQFIIPGAIDVNIMSKVDNPRYTKAGEKMPDEYSDALSALRGFANSRLSSSVVFSAGYNPRLFGYTEQFDNFFPNEHGALRKKIILKVSDYRSALVQGKILAKKGLWVSEFRIESGLNCGGHAFATDGLLMGPILQEFKENRDNLFSELFSLCNDALRKKEKNVFNVLPVQKITAQGGIGTAKEQEFLTSYYNLDGTGWGSPFLLVPEATNVDDGTLAQLAAAKQEDYYLSNASPLGVPFNNFRRSTSEQQRKQRIERDRPGSPCYKKYLSSNTEFTEIPICTASRKYQHLKIKTIAATSPNKEVLTAEIERIEE